MASAPSIPAAPSAPSSTRRSTTQRLGRRPVLDGLRGLAVLLVICVHVGVLATGYIGVDIFFALSGFLITTLLYEEWERTGDISLRRFYERRARRLLPALWLLVAAFAIVMIAVHPFAAQWPLGRLALTTLLFANNWVTALVPAHGRVLGALVPTWSLAQEAQFYLLWPLALWALLRHGARPGAVLGLLGLAIAALLATVPLVRHAYPSYNPYINPLDRGAELLLGCAAAIAWRTRLVPAALRSRTAGWALAGGLVVVLGHSGGVPEEWIYLSAAVLATLLITNLLTGPRRSPAFAALRWVGLPDQGLLAGIFCAAPLRYTGKVSYGLYLYHLPIYYLFWHYLPGRSPYFYAPIVLGLSFAAAAGSWWMIERPAIIHHRAAQTRGRPRHRSAARHRWRAALRSAIRVPAHGDPVRERRPSALGLSTEARR